METRAALQSPGADPAPSNLMIVLIIVTRMRSMKLNATKVVMLVLRRERKKIKFQLERS